MPVTRTLYRVSKAFNKMQNLQVFEREVITFDVISAPVILLSHYDLFNSPESVPCLFFQLSKIKEVIRGNL